jgi:hypothetical protein
MTVHLADSPVSSKEALLESWDGQDRKAVHAFSQGVKLATYMRLVTSSSMLYLPIIKLWVIETNNSLQSP